jgi:hypothetical protein
MNEKAMILLSTLSNALCLLSTPVSGARKFVDRMVEHFTNVSPSIHYNPDTNQCRREANRKACKKYRLKRLTREQLLSRLESGVMKFLCYGGLLPQGNLPRRFDHLHSSLDVICEEIGFVERQLEELLSTKLRQVGVFPNKGLRTEQLEAELLHFWKNR